MRISSFILGARTLCLVLIPGMVFAGSAPLDGAKIVSTYAGPEATSITDDQFTQFVLNEALGRVALDRPSVEGYPTMDADGFRGAWLDCAFTSTSYSKDKGKVTPADGAEIGVAELDSRPRPPVWSAVRYEVLRHQREILRSISSEKPYGTEVLDAYLAARKPKTLGYPEKRQDLRELADDAGNVVLNDLARYSLQVLLRQSDSDGSGRLDVWEFRAGLAKAKVCSDSKAYAAFVNLTVLQRKGATTIELGNGVSLAASIYQSLSEPSKPLTAWADKAAAKIWASTVRAGSSESVSATAFIQMEKKNSPKPSRVFKGEGILLSPKPRLQEGKSVFNDDEASWWLQIRKDLRTPGVGAETATFSLGQDADRVESVRLNGAIGLAWKGPWDPDLQHSALVSAKFDRSRVKGTDPSNVDKREYYVGWSGLYANDSEGLTGHRLRLGLQRQEDQQADVIRNALVAEWYPSMGSGKLRSGWWNDLVSEKLEYYYIPAIALDAGDYESNVAKIDELPSLIRIELGVGLRLFEDLTLQSKSRLFTDLTDLGRSYGHQELSLSWSLGGMDGLALTGTYKNGNEAPTFASEESVLVGLGIKF